MRTHLLICSALCLATAAPAQNLRRGLADADAVVVGRQVGKRPHSDEVSLHRVQVIADVRGAAGNTAVTVLDWPKLSVHIRPMPRQSRLYCLKDATAVANRLGLPAAKGPYFKMVGWAGSHPLVGQDLERDPLVRFARLMAQSENGASPDDTATALAAMALEPHRALRYEATRYLNERGDLRAKLTSIVWNRLVARATGEVDDIEYKIALAQLCAEQRLDGLLAALSVSLGQVTDAEYARCVGRIGKFLHGEAATATLMQRLQQAGQDQDRKMLLLAIGATNTESALAALLRMDKRDDAVVAALKEHRSQRAKDAVSDRK